MSSTDPFWTEIDAQLHVIASTKADTFDKVAAILNDTAYPAVREYSAGDPHTFFAGGDGDNTLQAALYAAGWRVTAYEAYYYYAMRNEATGDALTYIEGDVFHGDSLSPVIAKQEDMDEARQNATSGYYDASDGEPISSDDLENRFRDMLDDALEPVKIGELEWAPSDAFKRLGPIAYRVEFSDWTSNENGETITDDAEEAYDLRHPEEETRTHSGASLRDFTLTLEESEHIARIRGER